jgi:hypothetical protein
MDKCLFVYVSFALELAWEEYNFREISEAYNALALTD